MLGVRLILTTGPWRGGVGGKVTIPVLQMGKPRFGEGTIRGHVASAELGLKPGLAGVRPLGYTACLTEGLKHGDNDEQRSL